MGWNKLLLYYDSDIITLFKQMRERERERERESDFVAVGVIDGEKISTRRKPPTCGKPLSHNVVSSTPRPSWIRTQIMQFIYISVVGLDCVWTSKPCSLKMYWQPVNYFVVQYVN